MIDDAGNDSVGFPAGVSAQEMAAVLAALRTVQPSHEPSNYERWRQQRLAALRTSRAGARRE